MELISINNNLIACYYKKLNLNAIKSEFPPMVLIHGYTGSVLHHFRYELEHYSKSFQTDVLAFDLRGHGNSNTGNYEELGIDIYIEDLEKIIDHYNFKELILVGASFGGILANRYAIKYPNKVKKLILISTTAESSPGMINALIEIKQIIDNFIAVDYDMNKLDSQSMKFLSILMKIHFESFPYNKLIFFRFFINKFINRNFSFLEDIKKNIKCPALILHGENDYVEVENAKKMHSYFHDSKLVVIPNQGHLPQRKDPKLVEKHIKEFLNPIQ